MPETVENGRGTKHSRWSIALLVLGIIVISYFAFALIQLTSNGSSAPPAFPGAEGFGADTKGGRGGNVIQVTNLNDSGPGSFRAAIEATGPRIVVFRVGGTITTTTKYPILNPNITIAGQTAPGGGITIKGGHIQVMADDVIIRGLRIRAGDLPQGLPGEQRDALSVENKDAAVANVIVDHNSLSWAADENLSTWGQNSNVTFSWNIISEGLQKGIHPKGVHSMGLLIGDHTKHISVHHNLFAHNNQRNTYNKGDTDSEVINNVMYNWGEDATRLYDFEGTGPIVGNVINNYYKAGVDSNRKNVLQISSSNARVYAKGNFGASDIGTSPVAAQSGTVTTEPVQNAYSSVLAAAGAAKGIDCNGNWYARPDAVDIRIIDEVKNRTGRIIDSQSQVGGWPQIAAGTPCQDTDNDGMPNSWEAARGLNPNADDSAEAKDGNYSNIENYINGSSATVPAGGSLLR